MEHCSPGAPHQRTSLGVLFCTGWHVDLEFRGGRREARSNQTDDGDGYRGSAANTTFADFDSAENAPGQGSTKKTHNPP